MMVRRIVIGAAAIAAAFSAYAAEPLTSVVPTCDGTGSLVIVATTDSVAKSIAGLVDDAQREQLVQLLQGQLCARRGPYSGAWLLAGTMNAMDVGVIPYGDRSGLLIAKPRHTVIPLLEARFEPK